MSFLAFSAPLAFALLAAVAMLIVLLYWLKPTPKRIKVASNLIWRTLETAQLPALHRRRWWLSLLLALATGLSIALALTRPQAPALGGIAQRVVLVLDNSPSMAARAGDANSRWERAIERARSIILGAGVASEFMVLDTLGRADSPQWVGRNSALAKLHKLTWSASGAARMPLIPAAKNIEAHLLTDGVAGLDAAPDIAVESMFTPVDNVAITAFDAKPSRRDPTRYQALVQVFNASIRPKQVRLALTGENGFTLERDLSIAAGTTINQTLDLSGYAAGVLRAEVRAAGDGFDLDDVAYGVVEPHRAKQVLLVTTGNRHLEASLKLLPGVALALTKPAQFSAAPKFDAYIFDRFAPLESPVSSALFFRPPPRTWLPGFDRAVANPVITRWDESYPLGANVSWRDVQVQRAMLAKRSAPGTQTDVVLAKGSGEGVLVLADSQAPRRITVGFALDDSNLAMQSGFPVFLGNAIDWLTRDVATIARGLGHVEIPYANAKVTSRDGKPVATLSVAGATMFDAVRPDVFTAVSSAGTTRVVTNVIGAKFSDINRSPFAQVRDVVAQTSVAPRFAFEPWVALLLLAVALLAFEWVTFARGATI